MADWFVDANTTTGNGTDPASPYASLSSITWADGDIAWVRRTHVECANYDRTVFPVHTLTTFTKAFAIVGWPDSGDPFHNRRPARGVTVGWDSDLPATNVYSLYGYKFPTICGSATSTTTCTNMGRGITVANLCINQIGSYNGLPIRILASEWRNIWDNVLFTRSNSVFSRFAASGLPQQMDKVIIPCSEASGTGLLDNTGYEIGHLVLPSQTVIGNGGILRSTSQIARIRLLENQSNSVCNFFPANLAPTGPFVASNIIERAVGIEPLFNIATGDNTSQNDARCVVDDYYGKGPRVWNDENGKMCYRGCSSAEAMHNGKRAVYVSVKSVGTLRQWLFGDHNFTPIMRSYVSVTSGTTITLQLPVYVGSAALSTVMSVNAFGFRTNLLAAGCKAQVTDTKSGVVAGNVSSWSGTFISGGSAWLLRFQFTPAETGIVPFEVFLPQWTQATSGVGFPCNALFSEPYSV